MARDEDPEERTKARERWTPNQTRISDIFCTCMSFAFRIKSAENIGGVKDRTAVGVDGGEFSCHLFWAFHIAIHPDGLRVLPWRCSASLRLLCDVAARGEPATNMSFFKRDVFPCRFLPNKKNYPPGPGHGWVTKETMLQANQTRSLQSFFLQLIRTPVQ